MAWRLRHGTSKLYRADGTVREAAIHHESIMDVGQRAAEQQLAFYVQGWVDEDPENRAAHVRDRRNVTLLSRPAGCDCVVCTRYVPESPQYGPARTWDFWGGSHGHEGSWVHLERLDAPVTRAATEQYRVVDRVLDDRGQIEAGRAPTVWSRHFTKAEAQKGLVAAVGRWRNGSHKTAVRYSNDSYMLRWSRRDYSLLAIERIP